MLIRPMLTTITITMHSMLVRQEVSFHFRVLGLLGTNDLLGTNRVPVRLVTGIARPPKRLHECLSKA